MAEPDDAELERFLHGLRIHESNDSNANNPHTSASGFYQYTDPTWNNYQGYSRAVDAPFEVQHQRAREDATRHFRRYGNWEQVAAHHFYPAWADDPSRWGQSPGHPSNPTMREFVDSVMANRPAQSPEPEQGPSQPQGGSNPSPAQPASQPTATDTDLSSDPASNDSRIKVVQDNRGSFWVVDFRVGSRHALSGPGSGQFRAATALYGSPITSRSDLPSSWRTVQDNVFGQRDEILLDARLGYQEGDSTLEFFGGPNTMEEVVAGRRDDPFTNSRVANPKTITTGTGEEITAIGGGDDPTDDLENQRNVNAHAQLRQTLRDYGLESLADWAWESLQDGRTAAWIEAELPNRPEFRDRFPAIHQMREQDLTPPSASEYVQYEQQVEQLASSLGLPDEIRSQDSVTNMLVNRVDPQQVSQFAGLYDRFRSLGLA